MARLHTREVFSERGMFRVTKPFKFIGVEYAIGDAFDWRAAGCDSRRLRQLWEQRRLVCDAGEAGEADPITDKGRGWWEIAVPGIPTRKIRGKREDAERVLAEMTEAVTAGAVVE